MLCLAKWFGSCMFCIVDVLFSCLWIPNIFLFLRVLPKGLRIRCSGMSSHVEWSEINITNSCSSCLSCPSDSTKHGLCMRHTSRGVCILCVRIRVHVCLYMCIRLHGRMCICLRGCGACGHMCVCTHTLKSEWVDLNLH